MTALRLLLAGLPLVACFEHPGLLVSSHDVSRLQGKLAENLAPWNTSWEVFISMGPSNVPYTPQAVATVDRDAEGDTAANAYLLWEDATAAFALALRWKIEGNSSYADAAADILTSWAGNLTSLGANDDQYLVAGLQGHELANAGELLRDYAPFKENGLSSFQSMMQDIFLEKNLYFLNHLDGSEHNVLHFFANWELAQVASVLAIGVLTDNQTTWDFGINYFKHGSGNGAINNAITNIVEEPGTGNLLGQGQEEGRDQGHSSLDYALLGVIAQQAWNQGEDLYAYNNSRILLGAEYFARYNLGYDVPFVNYTNGIVSYTEVGSGSRGSVRWAWEVLYNHYVKIRGQNAPWTTKYWNLSLETWGGSEIGSGAYGSRAVSGYYDTMGWGTILYRLNDADAAAACAVFASSNASSSTASSSVSSLSTSSSSTSFSIAPSSIAPSSSATVDVSPVSVSSLESINLVQFATSSSPVACGAAALLTTIETEGSPRPLKKHSGKDAWGHLHKHVSAHGNPLVHGH